VAQIQQQSSFALKPTEITTDHVHIIYDADTLAEPVDLCFDPGALSARGLLVGEARGRGVVHFIRVAGRDCALRHYRRGGVVARFARDTYFWVGLRRTRAWQEWLMLQILWQRGLPVPRPIAARVVRRGPFYKADIVTERLQRTQALARVLSERALDPRQWKAIGACIRRFHNAGVYHADLNAHNILLAPDDAVFLIDLDKSRFYGDAGGWRGRNLARLHRSLRKLCSLSASFHFSEQAWQTLCEGYG
jgi:3-deoxy-D-manno-octulosonic acid kinase